MNRIDQQILFISGKGGVGKSTVAASLALRLSQSGKKVLLVELNEQSHFQILLEEPFTYSPVEWRPNLWVSCWNGEACLREYFKHYVRIETLVDLFFKNVVMRTFIQAAPALREISILGKATSGIRGVGPAFEYDIVVIDAFATGHFRALLRAPKGLAEAVRFGPMGEQSRQIEAILKNPKNCQYRVVTLPEELPVSECQDLVENLRSEWGIVPKIICNRFWEIPGTKSDLRALKEELNNARDEEGIEFIRYLEVVMDRQQSAIHKLRSFAEDFDILPLQFCSTGTRLIDELAERIKISDFLVS